MSEIKRLVKYVYNGQEYNRLEDIKTKVENTLGVMVDKTDNSHVLTPQQKLNIFNMLVNNREELISLLTVEIDYSDNCMYEDMKNILDTHDEL